MKITISILFFLFINNNELIAQNQSDSLYIESVDSTRKERKKNGRSMHYKQFKDTLNNRTVVKTFENNNLISIYYLNENLPCSENVTFHLQNDSLVFVEYTVSAPDIRSSRPASKSYSIYFKNDTQIHYSTSFYHGEINCTLPPLKDKNFIEEFYHYKYLNI